MKQYLNFVFIVCIILSFNLVKADQIVGGDELTLRNQLFADVFLLKEGVDRLQISVEVLSKRYNNQIDILKDIQTKFSVVNNYDDDICDKMGASLNATYRKYQSFETRITTKLDEIQDEQTTRLDQILVKQNLIKSTCSSQGGSSSTLTMMSDILSQVNEKINSFEEKFKKLESLETKFNLQQSQLELFNQNQMNILQDINEKLLKNQQQFEKFHKELPNFNDITNNINQITQKKHPRLPMEVILGLTNANTTKSN